MCYWRQQNTDNFDWIRHRYVTPSLNTGPKVDHTTGSGNYSQNKDIIE